MLLGDLAGADEPLKSAWRRIEIAGLTSDSRKVGKGDLFAALAGSHLDGARFAADAVRRGAAAILADADAKLPHGLGVPIIASACPRKSLALMAARFYGGQPETVAAITGTNGKTSVASFLRQIWAANGCAAASLGTVGVVTAAAARPLQHTTPEPVELHQITAGLAREGVTHLAVEASSHGLAQYRIDGLRIALAGFTNITRDHLDYHADFDDYFAQKLRLFTQVLADGGTAVVNADSDHAHAVLAALKARDVRVFTVGEAGADLRLAAHARDGFVQRLDIRDGDGQVHKVSLPLAGNFQTSNALVAAGLAIAGGVAPGRALGALEQLQGALGRLELVGATANGAPVFVDYAHTPDALKTALETLRPYASRRLVVVFGAGGDRDRGKRPEMGAVAARHADIAIVTDDNPRSESPSAIRAEILAAVPDAVEIGDRRTAIAAGIRMLRAGDVLLVAGKGHESGQKVGDQLIAFSDHEAVRASLGEIRRRA